MDTIRKLNSIGLLITSLLVYLTYSALKNAEYVYWQKGDDFTYAFGHGGGVILLSILIIGTSLIWCCMALFSEIPGETSIFTLLLVLAHLLCWTVMISPTTFIGDLKFETYSKKAQVDIMNVAAKRGDLVTLEAALKHGLDINSLNLGKASPLHSAIDALQIKSVQFLLERGANPNLIDDSNQTPLDLATQRNVSSEIKNELIKYGGKHLLDLGLSKDRISELLKNANSEKDKFEQSVGNKPSEILDRDLKTK